MNHPIYKKDGFSLFREKKGDNSILGDTLIIDNHNIHELKSFINKNLIKGVRIIPSYYNVQNLDFLNELNFIEGVYIIGNENFDLTPLYALTNLRVLGIEKISTTLDFGRFPNLEVYGSQYSKKILNMGKCANLFWLWLDNYKEDDLYAIESLTKLKFLTLYKTSIINLLGIKEFKQLEVLSIDTANKLESLNGFTEANQILEKIDIYRAKNLLDCSSLSRASGLKKIWIRKTGDLNNIDFIKGLPNLDEVVIDAKINDGNLNLLKGIRNVSFREFPHYNLKSKDFS